MTAACKHGFTEHVLFEFLHNSIPWSNLVPCKSIKVQQCVSLARSWKRVQFFRTNQDKVPTLLEVKVDSNQNRDKGRALALNWM